MHRKQQDVSARNPQGIHTFCSRTIGISKKPSIANPFPKHATRLRDAPIYLRQAPSMQIGPSLEFAYDDSGHYKIPA